MYNLKCIANKLIDVLGTSVKLNENVSKLKTLKRFWVTNRPY